VNKAILVIFMKTYNNLFEHIISFNNLYSAYKKASYGKRYRMDVLLFSKNLEENLINIQKQLMSKTWIPKPFRCFYVYDPKKREIHAPEFDDRIVHHALCNIIEPLFERKFIYDSYACRKRKGIHLAVKRVQQNIFINDYVLKADISKYFPSINHDVLLSIIKKTVSCKDTIWFIETIIKSHKNGLPIGALTSQLFANVYLDQLDHYIKDYLGVKRYFRYMDDIIILHPNKKYLGELLKAIQHYLFSKLCLVLNNKTSIFPARHGIDFCGYRIWKTHIKLRKRNIKKTKRKFKKYVRLYKANKINFSRIYASFMSFLGYAKHSNNLNAIISIISILIGGSTTQIKNLINRPSADILYKNFVNSQNSIAYNRQNKRVNQYHKILSLICNLLSFICNTSIIFYAICLKCGTYHDRDINASVNLMLYGIKQVGMEQPEYWKKK